MRKEPREPLDRDHLLLFRTLCAPHNLQRAVSQLGMPQATAPGVTFRLSPNGDDWVVELQKGDLDFLNNLATEVGGFLRLFL